MAQLVRRRVVNPAPSVLALVNPRRRKTKMATRKRKRSTKRRTVRARAHNPVNPTRRRRRSSTRRRHGVTVHARRRNPINPTRRRRRIGRRRHHRNPFGGSGEVIDFAGAGIALGLFQPFVARFAGPYAGALGQFGGPALTALSGWGLSKIFEMFGFTRRFAKPARILGYSTAVIQIVQPLVSRALAGVGAPANPMMSGWGNGAQSGWRRPMRGIGVTTGIPPMITPPPMPQGNNQQGMSGMGVRPGNFAY